MRFTCRSGDWAVVSAQTRGQPTAIAKQKNEREQQGHWTTSTSSPTRAAAAAGQQQQTHRLGGFEFEIFSVTVDAHLAPRKTCEGRRRFEFAAVTITITITTAATRCSQKEARESAPGGERDASVPANRSRKGNG